jgi:peptidyl-prolyl cis-trans isomerase B (cyclophilin B)
MARHKSRGFEYFYPALPIPGVGISVRDIAAGSWHTNRMMKKLTYLMSIAALLAAGVCAQAQSNNAAKPPAPPAPPAVPSAKPADAKPAEATAAKEVAVIKTTAGEMVVEFWSDVAPKTVDNFKTLAKKGFYDGTAFHRIIKGFMIQGGDPLTTNDVNKANFGGGGPGYTIPDEFNDRQHVRGVLSMANTGRPNSGGSQFFICLDRTASLDHHYTGFGKVIKGEDVLLKIGETPVAPSSRGEMSVPQTRVAIESVKIVPADSVK